MFGANKPTFGTQQTPGGFGGFGQATANPFGQPASAFGKPTATTFGQPAAAFGQQNTSTVFGASTQQPTGGLFGSNQITTSTGSGFGTFGQQQNTSIFGQNNASTSLFGGTAQASTFGAKPAGFGAFGGSQLGSTPFAQPITTQPQTTGLFGQPAATNSGGLFGSTVATQQPAFGQTTLGGGNGTAIVKYQPQLSTDTLLKGGQTNSVSTKQHCITFMKEYEAKSIEELRLEDYQANRKGPQAGTSSALLGSTQQASGMFGAPQQPTGLFGQTAQSTQNTSGLFGSSNTMGGSAFGQNTSTFGQANSGGLFGKPPFSTPATTASSFAFGATTNTASTPFGVAKPLFGQTAVQSTSFGQPTTSTFGSFGQTTSFGQQQPQQAAPSLFGQPQVSTAQPTFGLGTNTTQTQGFGGFGSTNTSTAGTGLFSKPATGFGAAPAFGQQPPTSSSLFGTANTGTSLFNNSFNKPAAPTFGFGQQPTSAPLNAGLGMNTQNNLFGNVANKPTGMFGSAPTGGGLFSSAPAFGTNTGLSLGGTNAFGGNIMNQQQPPAAPPIHQQILSLASNPYGENPIFKDLKPNAESSEDSLKPTNPAAQKAVLESSNQFKVSPKSTSKIKVKPIGNVVSKKSLFDGLEEYDGTLEESFAAKPNAKRLIIKPKSSPAPNASGNISNLNISLKQKATVEQQSVNLELEANKDDTELFQNQIPLNPINDNVDNGRRVSWLRTAPLPPMNCLRQQQQQQQKNLDSTINQLQSSDAENNKKRDDKSGNDTNSPDISLANESFLSNHNLDDTANDPDASLVGSGEPHPTGIVMRRPGYYMIPTLDELIEYLDEDGRCVVPNFTIGRKGYGNVFFNESIDVSGLNLDEIVHFRHKEVILYPDDENKPPIGEGLNRKAQVTLDQVWPHDKTKHESIKDPARLEAMNYEGKLRRVCEKHDTKFLEYRPDTGSCVFKVEHFSKYTLDDSDEDDAPVDPKKAKMTMAPVPPAKKDVIVIKAPLAQAGRQKSQESVNYLGQHMGQRSFQQIIIDEDLESTQEAPTSPSAALAMEMRTDSHKLQLMKASFFVEEDYDTRSFASEISEGHESPDQTVPTFKSLTAPKYDLIASVLAHENHEQDADEIVQEKQSEMAVQTYIMKPIGPKSLPMIVRPRIIQYNVSDISLPLKDSILDRMISGKGGNLTFFNGRKFKNGWASKNYLTILNTMHNFNNQQQGLQIENIFGGRKFADKSPPIVQIIQVKSMQKETLEIFRKSIEEHLHIELRLDKKMLGENSDCPYFEANGGTEGLEKHLEAAKKLMQETNRDAEHYNETVWSLMNALWGFQEELEDEDPTNHQSVTFRRNLLSTWIENVVTDKDLTKKNKEYLDRLLDLILCHKVSSVCELAFQNDDINLSLLISQISGGPTVRQLMQHQLAAWQEIEADQFIDVKRLKIMMLIAGIPTHASCYHGPINIFESLDWLKCFAIQLWYLCSPTASVTDTLIAYERSFENDEMMLVSQPIPGHMKNYDTTKKLFDLRYHLLKLYSVKSHPMETLLHPANYTPDICDFRMSFLLLQQLETLGYRHCSELCKSKIYTSLAEQLENYGMWEWSIYILLHIPNQLQRELAVQQLLYRYIRVDGEQHSNAMDYIEKEQFIIDQLRVPEKWIFWAKAVRAGSFHNYNVQAKYLLKARQWTQAHDIILQHIAPDAIINENFTYLKSLLEQFEEVQSIANWSTQGQILIDFIEMSEKFDFLQENTESVIEEDLEMFLEQIKPKLSDLCSTIKLFPCPTSKHRLCQSEISQKLAFIIRSFYATSANSDEDPCALMRLALEKLPLSQEFARQELRHVLTAFLKEKLTIN